MKATAVGAAAARRAEAGAVRSVADTIEAFYEEYPQPPLLPTYRVFLLDFLTQSHLAVMDARFRYDSLWALGLSVQLDGILASYDRTFASSAGGNGGGGGQATGIRRAFVTALRLDPAQVAADVAATRRLARSWNASANIEHLAKRPPWRGLRSSQGRDILQASASSVGLLEVMELAGVEISKSTISQWAEAFGLSVSRTISDVETFKLNANKLRKVEETLRDVEIREKKALAERLASRAVAVASDAAPQAA